MFNVPDGDDFDDAALEDELEAILSGKQPLVKRDLNDRQSKPSNQTASNRNQINKQQQSNLYDLNLNFNDLNLNDNDDDDNIDENDPDLNAQLAAICGSEELPAYQPNRSSNSFNNNVQVTRSQPQPNILLPTRPAPTLNEQQQQNCLILNNSHFVDNENSKLDQLSKRKDELKSLALDAKRNNDMDSAKQYIKEMKDIETQIDNLNKKINDPTPIMKPNIIRQQELNETYQSNTSSTQTKTLLEALEERRQKIESNLNKEQAANNTSKVRMLTRILKQFDSAIKANKLGKEFDYESLPEIHGFGELPLKNNKSINNQLNKPTFNQQTAIQSTPKVSAPVPKTSSSSKLEQLEKWKNEFKLLALESKRNNDLNDAKLYLQKMKEVSNAIDSLNNGQQIDLSTISSPNSFKEQKTTEPTELDEEQIRKLCKVPPPASTLLEALEQRRAKFQNTLEKEQSANNSSKVKTTARVLKQYDSAIKANKLGKEFDYKSLPIPFGFSELPLSNNQQQQENKQSNKSSSNISQPTTSTTSSTAPPRPKPVMKRQISSLNNKQLEYLKQRQKLFKEAAVESNKKGDTSQALDYLRKAKGFDPLIMAVENGLPIDISNIPVPPQLDADDFVMISKSDDMDLTGLDLDKEEHYRKLELELEKQINMCTKNKDHFFKIGDVSSATKFEKYLNDMKKDYELLRNHKLRNENIPKYHYENKSFSIVVVNTDVSTNELTVEIMRAIDLPCKQEVDSFVKFQFDFPKETPQYGRTHSFKNSLYPEYNQNFKFQIDRKSRALARIFGKSMKFEIYSKGSDELIGHVIVDLSPLKSRCTIFDSFPIMNGRREIGGKLQLRIKIREPLLAKEITEIKEKWIVFDNN